MKKLLLVLLMVVSSIANAGLTKGEEEHQAFCKDMAGMAVIFGQLRDKGIDMIRAVSEMTYWLNEHPEFYATPGEKEEAIVVIKTVYKYPGIVGDELGDIIYRDCLATKATL
jgi:hypothetical protein